MASSIIGIEFDYNDCSFLLLWMAGALDQYRQESPRFVKLRALPPVLSRHASGGILRVNSKSAYPRRPRLHGRLGVIWPP